MSGLTEQFSAELEEKSVLDLVREYYHVPLLTLAVVFSLWVRTRGWDEFTTGGEVLFAGNDAWYHLRTVTYTVQNWPFTMPFDPWTYYPYGTSSGQFGTLYDQLIATAALVVGLGSPTEQQIAMTHLFAPAVFGALALIPAYYLTKRVSDRNGGLVAVLLLSLTTGQFLTRGVVGFSDHHIAETFFLATAAVAVATSLVVAEEEKPVYELATARDWGALKRPVLWGGLAGVALALYLWTWPPGVFMLGILGIFFAIAMSVHQVRGISPDHIAVPGVTMGVVAGLLTLVTADTFTVSAVALSLLQPLLAFGLAAGCAFLAALARVWDDREIGDWYYPLTILGIGLAGAGLLAVAAPGFFDYLVNQVLRVFGYDATAQSRTVAEAQPIPVEAASTFFMQSYGLAIYTAVGGFALMLYKFAVADDGRTDHMFVLVLAAFLFMATMTQRRFDYYFAIPVAALNGYLAMVVFDLVDIGEAVDSLDDIKAYQVMAVLSVLVLVVAPLTLGTSAWAVTQDRSGPGEVSAWTGSLDWMQDNTPVEGAYGTGGEQSLDYYGTYEPTDDYDYSDGTYGVMAWWDYGHWLTVLGHRIPNANPFQQGATEAANALLAPNESAASDVMDHQSGEDTRYVVVDYQLGVAGTTKFSAPLVFETEYGLSDTDTNLDNDVARTIFSPETGQASRVIHAPRSYESLRVRLYQFHGSATSPDQFRTPVVTDFDTTTGEGRTYLLAPENGRTIKTFPNMSAAREFVRQDGTAQIGGLPGYPSKDIPALEHYRLVHASERTVGPLQLGQNYSWVKTFERVPGATLEGQAPANSNVTATVRMRIDSTNKTFVYRQHARTGPDGEFTMTLPYSTEGYDQWGTAEGYTNVDVRAVGPYQVTTEFESFDNGTYVRHSGTANVTEAQVIGESDEPVTVELQRRSIDLSQDGNETNTTDTNGTDTTDTDTSANTSDGTNTTDANTSSSLAAPPRAARAG
ncbi:oligosaccharyl transferase, archaeosortase A system-associated [Halorarius halobius]|uniref:oligosaccharyl transferase, archaeosortase A system-associated n=1 Tax=Halorarius halobius TaxID=2962671 RepID=UPI0020CFE4F4|nr:oligosaccharyl transferase, archaeosortase A system-associated [Halorarius halobius]